MVAFNDDVLIRGRIYLYVKFAKSRPFCSGITNIKLNPTLTICASFICSCDLAGSERLKKTMAEGERLCEAQHINSSLLELGWELFSGVVAMALHVSSYLSLLWLLHDLLCVGVTTDYESPAMLSFDWIFEEGVKGNGHCCDTLWTVKFLWVCRVKYLLWLSFCFVHQKCYPSTRWRQENACALSEFHSHKIAPGEFRRKLQNKLSGM